MHRRAYIGHGWARWWPISELRDIAMEFFLCHLIYNCISIISQANAATLNQARISQDYACNLNTEDANLWQLILLSFHSRTCNELSALCKGEMKRHSHLTRPLLTIRHSCHEKLLMYLLYALMPTRKVNDIICHLALWCCNYRQGG